MNAENKNLKHDPNKPDTPRSKVYDADFRKKAVRRLRAGESSVTVSRNLSVPTGTLSKWKNDPRLAEPPRNINDRMPKPSFSSPTISDLAIIASNLDGADDLRKIERAANLWKLAETWHYHKEIADYMEGITVDKKVPFEQAVTEARIPKKSPADWLRLTLLQPDCFKKAFDQTSSEILHRLYQDCGGAALYALIIDDQELPTIEAEEVDSIINHWKATGIHLHFVANLRDIRGEEDSRQKSKAGAKGGKKSSPAS